MKEIEIGAKAPNFKLVGTDLKPIELADYSGKTLVLHFFPFAFSNTCTAQMCTAANEENNYNDLDAEVIGVSVDSPFTLQKFASDHKLNFQLGSDFTRDTSRAYGVLYTDDFLGLTEFSKRAVFVINQTGHIEYMELVTDGKSIPNFEKLREAIAKLN